MKKTIEQCDLCGADITGQYDGILELRVRERWCLYGEPDHGKDRRTILICPYCKVKIQRIFMDEKDGEDNG